MENIVYLRVIQIAIAMIVVEFTLFYYTSISAVHYVLKECFLSKTGDTTQLGLWVTAVLLSGILLGLFWEKKDKAF